MILPATLGEREEGKDEYPYFTHWETEVQKGEVTCPRSHSKSGLLTPSLVHFPHRDRGQRPGETETRGRERHGGQGAWRGRETETEKVTETMTITTAPSANGHKHMVTTVTVH